MYARLRVEASTTATPFDRPVLGGEGSPSTAKMATSSRGGSSPSDRCKNAPSRGVQPLFASPSSPLASSTYRSPRPPSSKSQSGSGAKSKPLVVTYNALRNFDRAQSGEHRRPDACDWPSPPRATATMDSTPRVEAGRASKGRTRMVCKIVARVVAAITMIVGAVCNVVVFGELFACELAPSVVVGRSSD